MTLFVEREKCEFVCPSCGGEMEKVTRPVNHQVFECVDCEDEFGEGYLNGYNDAMKKVLAELERNPTRRGADVMNCGHPWEEQYKGEDGGLYCRTCECA